MVDREKVLSGLESCADHTGRKCRTCPYDFAHNDYCMGDMARDALELLKADNERIEALETMLDFSTAIVADVVGRKKKEKGMDNE